MAKKSTRPREAPLLGLRKRQEERESGGQEFLKNLVHCSTSAENSYKKMRLDGRQDQLKKCKDLEKKKRKKD